jgi:hypothetical protein
MATRLQALVTASSVLNFSPSGSSNSTAQLHSPYARQIPSRLTHAIGGGFGGSEQLRQLPLLVMDTAPAAVLGALEDAVLAHPSAIIANIGNFHTLAFRYTDGKITGVFEHHTGELKPGQLETLSNNSRTDHSRMMLYSTRRGMARCSLTRTFRRLTFSPSSDRGAECSPDHAIAPTSRPHMAT